MPRDEDPKKVHSLWPSYSPHVQQAAALSLKPNVLLHEPWTEPSPNI